MPKKKARDLIHRFEGNPIITDGDLSFRCSDICNAGAVKHGDEYILLITIQSLQGFSSIYLARSRDGYRFDVEDKPFLSRSKDPAYAVYEQDGVIDARIVRLDGGYYICYDALGPHGYRLGLARTPDFTSVERLGLISQPDTKAGVLFPEKIRGRYARLERPWNGGNIWVAYSDDLRYWGWPEIVMTARGGYWDPSRIGVATPPLAVDQGWLFIYYGIKETSGGPLFRLGAAILDRDNPAEVVGRTDVPILSPREEYERIGDVPNLVFSCGAVLEPGGQLKLYYGASNSCICVGTAELNTIVQACLNGAGDFGS